MRLANLFLVFALAGCATAPATVVKLLPPDALLMDCDKAELTVNSNKALAEAFLARGANIDSCNNDKASLRAWVKESQ